MDHNQVKKPRRQMRYMRRMTKRCPECREEFSGCGRNIRKRNVWCIAVGPKDCGKTHMGYHTGGGGSVVLFQNARYHTMGASLVVIP